MLIELLIFLLLGICAGTITGLIPGLHINLIGAFLIALSISIFSSINPIFLIVFIVAMAITHTFLDFIPSIFLGCPDTDTELSVLPGHELLKKGQGHEAIILTAYGSLAAIFILLLIALPSIYVISKIYDMVTEDIMKIVIVGVLILASLLLILLEKHKLKALFVFLLTGILGLIVLNLNPETLNNPLLPLLTGLFGASTLIISIKTKTKIPEQKISKKIKAKIFKPLVGALIASPLCSFLPGLGSGQAAIIGNTISRTDTRGFLILLGATNTLVMGFSFISLYIISKTRTGAALAIQQIIGSLEKNTLILILFITLISGIISFFLTIKLSKYFSKKIEKINYTKLSILTLIFLVFLVFIFSGFTGSIIFIISTLTGIYCISLKVRRANFMGCLLLPTILLYLI